MKKITLSDHTGNQINAAAKLREDQHSRALAKFEMALAEQETKKQIARSKLAQAWANRQVWLTIKSFFSYVSQSLSKNPERPFKQGAGRDEVVWAAGSEGEDRVARFLASNLSDDWTLVAGYKNAKGEIDQILIGPAGVFAIEIKFVNGTVYCNADKWWRDKSDKYGNVVERNISIADKRGRSPSRQLNEAADLLAAFLEKRTGISRVRRVVVLSHDSSRIGSLANLTVDHVTTLCDWNLTRHLKSSVPPIEAAEIARVLQAIQKDHAFHEKPRLAKVC